MTAYHYTDCGLKNVYIHGLDIVDDDAGNATVHIPRINQLHRVISEGIVNHAHGMEGDEIRFLRSEMGYTQAQLATIMHVTQLTVGRWERSDNEIGGANEALLRRLSVEKLGLDASQSIEQFSAQSVPSAGIQTIDIDVANGNGYALQKLKAA